MARKGGGPTPGSFRPGDPRIQAGPGRTAGLLHFQAEIFKNLIDSPTSTTDPTPFVQTAVDQWKNAVRAGDKTAMSLFMERIALNPKVLEQADSILSSQKTQDLDYMSYRLHKRCFDEQQQVLLSKKPTVMLVCGRRAGKTETLATKIIETAISHSEGDVIYIGKTFSTAYEIIWRRLIDLLELVGLPYSAKIAEQTIVLGSGVNIYVRGAGTLVDIDKIRGKGLRLAVVDEIQSIKHLRLLVEEVLSPAMTDYEGSQIFLSGTPPKIRGTYVEEKWLTKNKFIAQFHWDATANVTMPDHEHWLENEKERRGLKDEDPIFQREYRGTMGIYDVDAMVFRPTNINFIGEGEIEQWVNQQRFESIYFVGGLDLGFSDSDAFGIVMASKELPDKWLVYEHKKNKDDVTALATAVKAGFEFMTTSTTFGKLFNPNKIKIFTDQGGGGSKIANELRKQWKLPTTPAIKNDKEFAIQELAQEIRTGRFKFYADGPWAQEIDKILYARDDNDNLTREISDEFHPDAMDMVLYALRPIWNTAGVKIGEVFNAPTPATPERKTPEFQQTFQVVDEVKPLRGRRKATDRRFS